MMMMMKSRALFLLCKKGEKEDEKKLINKFAGIIVKIIFM